MQVSDPTARTCVRARSLSLSLPPSPPLRFAEYTTAQKKIKWELLHTVAQFNACKYESSVNPAILFKHGRNFFQIQKIMIYKSFHANQQVSNSEKCQ